MVENLRFIYRLSGVQKVYGGRRVMDIDTLEVQSGEILALVGPSGSGKSTLLRLLNFLEPVTEGEIEFDGGRFTGGVSPPIEQRRTITTVFQRPMLLDRSVADNVSFGLRLRGMRNGHQAVSEVLDLVGLSNLSHHSARKLSGGEAQRVALARAMVIEPKVLLLDEPTANLDPYNVGLIERIVTDLNRERGVTLVLVTHNIFQARRLADRVVYISDGKVIETAETEQFFQAPTDPRTRAFVSGEVIY